MRKASARFCATTVGSLGAVSDAVGLMVDASVGALEMDGAESGVREEEATVADAADD
jgi:hypothetical protein